MLAPNDTKNDNAHSMKAPHSTLEGSPCRTGSSKAEKNGDGAATCPGRSKGTHLRLQGTGLHPKRDFKHGGRFPCAVSAICKGIKRKTQK